MKIGDIVLYEGQEFRIEKFYLNRARIVSLKHEYVGPLSCPRVSIAPLNDLRPVIDESVMM